MQRKGFKDVNRLHGGINNYAQFVKQTHVESTFKGNNIILSSRPIFVKRGSMFDLTFP